MRLLPVVPISVLLVGCAQKPAPVAEAPQPGYEAKTATTVAFTEGPTVDAAGNVFFTETVSNRIVKLTPSGETSVFRERSNAANGLLFDPRGRLLACEGAQPPKRPLGFGSHEDFTMKPRVTRTDMATGKVEVLADNFEGQPFTGPNDITMDNQERIYFTDLPGGAVYRIDTNGKLARILNRPDIQRPNGISISPDGKVLYLVEANQAEGGARMIRAYDLQSDGSVTNMRVFHNFYPGRSADGLCMDTAGNLHAAAGLHQRRGTSETLDTQCGIHVFSPEGKRIRFYPIPEDTITNCAFGGADRKTLYVTAGKGLYQLSVPVAGTTR